MCIKHISNSKIKLQTSLEILFLLKISLLQMTVIKINLLMEIYVHFIFRVDWLSEEFESSRNFGVYV